ncbi:23S rRNA (pseudouridine(1915)-N(3))-methyltransferase RlmH [Thermosulfuriphilus sp.]
MRFPLKINIVQVGHPKAAFVKKGLETYLPRLKRYLAAVEMITIKDSGLKKPEEARRSDTRQILARLPKKGYVIVLDEKGDDLTSLEFAEMLRRLTDQGIREIYLVIGGPYGLCQDVKKRAKKILALSRLTLPHELALLILVEQIFRALTIISGEGYHH